MIVWLIVIVFHEIRKNLKSLKTITSLIHSFVFLNNIQ